MGKAPGNQGLQKGARDAGSRGFHRLNHSLPVWTWPGACASSAQWGYSDHHLTKPLWGSNNTRESTANSTAYTNLTGQIIKSGRHSHRVSRCRGKWGTDIIPALIKMPTCFVLLLGKAVRKSTLTRKFRLSKVLSFQPEQQLWEWQSHYQS